MLSNKRPNTVPNSFLEFLQLLFVIHSYMPSPAKELADYSAEDILDELQRRIFCRGRKESRLILVGPPG